MKMPRRRRDAVARCASDMANALADATVIARSIASQFVWATSDSDKHTRVWELADRLLEQCRAAFEASRELDGAVNFDIAMNVQLALEVRTAFYVAVADPAIRGMVNYDLASKEIDRLVSVGMRAKEIQLRAQKLRNGPLHADSNSADNRATVSPSARRMTGLAVSLLPTGFQLRYREEYEAELHELACISRRAQWVYAARILATVWFVRRALNEAGDAPAWDAGSP